MIVVGRQESAPSSKVTHRVNPLLAPCHRHLSVVGKCLPASGRIALTGALLLWRLAVLRDNLVVIAVRVFRQPMG